MTDLNDFTSDVKSLMPKWPWGRNFGLTLGLGLKVLASFNTIDIVTDLYTASIANSARVHSPQAQII